ncbi:hypothetical protein CDCA_CDCA10G2898 [Cyanidium caldarium]|uniref:Uncharacterized protein n=1 Tax=Cyanidium caldarium TaxID=2771 RepID=A0AAV9IXQ3_CYACA|nr:hypothetical protein CDCA_CDCA10G2898 [Cyanidium caldarium]
MIDHLSWSAPHIAPLEEVDSWLFSTLESYRSGVVTDLLMPSEGQAPPSGRLSPDAGSYEHLLAMPELSVSELNTLTTIARADPTEVAPTGGGGGGGGFDVTATSWLPEQPPPDPSATPSSSSEAVLPVRLPRVTIHVAPLGLDDAPEAVSTLIPSLSRPSLSPTGEFVVVGTEEFRPEHSHHNRLIHVSLQPLLSYTHSSQHAGSEEWLQLVGHLTPTTPTAAAVEPLRWWSCNVDSFVRDVRYWRDRGVLFALSRGRIGFLAVHSDDPCQGPTSPPLVRSIHRDDIRELLAAPDPADDLLLSAGFDGQLIGTCLTRAFEDSNGAADSAVRFRHCTGRPISSVRLCGDDGGNPAAWSGLCTCTMDDGALYLFDARVRPDDDCGAPLVLETRKPGLFAHAHLHGSAGTAVLGYSDGSLVLADLRMRQLVGTFRDPSQRAVGDLHSIASERFVSFGAPSCSVWRQVELNWRYEMLWCSRHFPNAALGCSGSTEGRAAPSNDYIVSGDVVDRANLVVTSDSLGNLSVYAL